MTSVWRDRAHSIVGKAVEGQAPPPKLTFASESLILRIRQPEAIFILKG